MKIIYMKTKANCIVPIRSAFKMILIFLMLKFSFLRRDGNPMEQDRENMENHRINGIKTET